MSESDQNIINSDSEIFPPANLFNKAKLEAFQLSAKEDEKLLEYNDLVVILGGSFSKGIGHYFSDSDWMFLSEKPIPREEFYNFFPTISSTYNRLVKENQVYEPLKRYAVIGKEINKRVTENKSTDKDKFASRILDRAAILQRAHHASYVETKHDNDMTNFDSPSFYVDQEIKPTLISTILNKVDSFDNNQIRASSYEDIILILSAEIGINAFEVENNKLYNYKKSIVNKILNFKHKDLENFDKFYAALKDSYLYFTRRGKYDYNRNHKSPNIVRQMHRTEKGEPMLNFYRKYSEFLDIEELNSFIESQNV